MKRSLVFIVLLILAAWAIVRHGSSDDGKVLRVRDGKIITFSQMMADARKSDIIFVGEIHDVEEHHRNELAIIKALHESDASMAVGLEMFRTDSQKTLDSWIRGQLPLQDFLPAYYDNWREPWPLYRDIFGYAKDHEIPMLGLNVSDRISKKVAREGFASLTREERKELPPGISCNVDPTYMAFIRRAYAGHPGNDRQFVNFCEAQMVWDKSMAWRLIAYEKQNKGRVVVVLAGVGHAWRRGIPEQVAAGSKYTTRVILPYVPDQIDRDNVTTKDADYVMLE